MTEAELEALCERADINEDEANDALRSVQVLCAAPPHGIRLAESDVSRVLWAAASLYSTMPEMQSEPGGFYRFVEEVTTLLKHAKVKRRSSVPANPMRA